MTGVSRVAVIRALALGILCHSISAEYLEPYCGIPGNLFGPKIVNGLDAPINSSPWMAYLHTSTIFICGGSLIHRRFILTAAHCLGLTMKARLGEYDPLTRKDCTVHGCSPSAEEHEIDMALRHGGFSMTDTSNDIALLRLKMPVQYKDHIIPICIIVNTANFPAMTWFKATGWGDTKTNRTSGALQEVILERLHPELCKASLKRTVQRDQFCAGSENRDTCSGDSGGPLGRQFNHRNQSRYVQLAVVSHGSPDCSGIGVYTDIIVHAPWIQQMVKRYEHRPVEPSNQAES